MHLTRRDEHGDGQLEFVQAVLSGKYDEAWMAGGNSGGKTFTGKFLGTMMSVYKIKPDKPDWPDYESFQAAPYSILCTGPEQKQAIELWEKVEESFKLSPFLKTLVSEITTSTRRDAHPKIVLKNGTTIDAIGLHDKGKHIEGEAYDAILINEPADVRHLKFILDRVLIPRTWRRGGIICGFGTPKGQEGQPGEYYDVFKAGMKVNMLGRPNPFYNERVYTSFVDSRTNVYADQDKIKKYLESGDENLIEERIKGLFVISRSSAFADKDIEAIIDEDLKWGQGLSSNQLPMHGTDFGRKEDATVNVTLDAAKKPFVLLDYYRMAPGMASWQEILNDILAINKKYGGEHVVDTTSTGGDMQQEWLMDLGIPIIPFRFSPTSKIKLINNLQDVIQKKEIRIPYIHQLIDELRTYPRNLDDKGLVTDSVMALALAVWGATQFSFVGENVSYRR